MTKYRDYGHYHQVIALDEKPATPQDSRGSQTMIDTPPHGTDDEPCWYCSGTGEDQRRPCPCCPHNEHHAAHPGGFVFKKGPQCV